VNVTVAEVENGVKARSYVDALLVDLGGNAGTHAIGYYDDELVLTDQSWKIARRHFTMEYRQEWSANNSMI
jgi:hypothetical protein